MTRSSHELTRHARELTISSPEHSRFSRELTRLSHELTRPCYEITRPLMNSQDHLMNSKTLMVSRKTLLWIHKPSAEYERTISPDRVCRMEHTRQARGLELLVANSGNTQPQRLQRCQWTTESPYNAVWITEKSITEAELSLLFGLDRADRRGRGSRRSGVQTTTEATGRPSEQLVSTQRRFMLLMLTLSTRRAMQNNWESDVLDHNTVTTNRVQTPVQNAIFDASVWWL